MRRGVNVAVYGFAWVLLTTLFPLWLTLALVRDVVARANFAAGRLLCFAWLYLGAELLGLIGAAWIWLRHRGTKERFLAANYALQQWWADLLLHAVKRTQGLRFVITGEEHLSPGPVLLFVRHASIIDTLIPASFVAQHGLRLRYVLKKELLVDPCLEVVGRRLPNYFVDRQGNTDDEIRAIHELAEGLGPREGVVIYPEGTRFSARKRERAIRSLARSHPELAKRAESMTHVLPPRLGGTRALLEHDVDVVFCGHTGLEGFATLGDMLSGDLVGSTVHIFFSRVEQTRIPSDSHGMADWLFDRWAEIDRECERRSH